MRSVVLGLVGGRPEAALTFDGSSTDEKFTQPLEKKEREDRKKKRTCHVDFGSSRCWREGRREIHSFLLYVRHRKVIKIQS